MIGRLPSSYRRGAGTVCLVVCLLGAACGDDGGETTAAPETTAASTTTAAPETTAAPTTTAAPETTAPAAEPIAMGISIAPGTPEAVQTLLAAGADRANAEFGTEVTYSWSEDVAAGLRDLAGSSEVVLAVGFGFEPAVSEVAGEFPEVVFVMVDGSADGPNTLSTRLAMNEAAFMAGAAAALTSDSGQVGFIGALPMPGVTTLEAGFVAGAEFADPEAAVRVVYLGEGDDWDAFGNPERARTAAAEMYGNGVDVILHGAGASGAGVFAAALEARSGGGTAWAIGVDFDQAAGAEADVAAVILTSAFRTLDGVVFWAAEQYAAGNLAGGEADLGIAEGAVGLATTGGFLEAILADLESYADLIADGTIVVPEQP